MQCFSGNPLTYSLNFPFLVCCWRVVLCCVVLCCVLDAWLLAAVHWSALCCAVCSCRWKWWKERLNHSGHVLICFLHFLIYFFYNSKTCYTAIKSTCLFKAMLVSCCLLCVSGTCVVQKSPLCVKSQSSTRVGPAWLPFTPRATRRNRVMNMNDKQ